MLALLTVSFWERLLLTGMHRLTTMLYVPMDGQASNHVRRSDQGSSCRSPFGRVLLPMLRCCLCFHPVNQQSSLPHGEVSTPSLEAGAYQRLPAAGERVHQEPGGFQGARRRHSELVICPASSLALELEFCLVRCGGPIAVGPLYALRTALSITGDFSRLASDMRCVINRR